MDARSDIFSFGSVLYEMVTGRRAFQGDTKASIMAAILKEEPKPPSQIAEGLPRELERIVRRCLRKDRSQRFQHMDDLKVALEELKKGVGFWRAGTPLFGGEETPTRTRCLAPSSSLASFWQPQPGIGLVVHVRCRWKPHWWLFL